MGQDIDALRARLMGFWLNASAAIETDILQLLHDGREDVRFPRSTASTCKISG